MTGEVIRFPGNNEGKTVEQWHDDLVDLHERLMTALMKDRKQIHNIRVVLSIDDVVDMCQVIEDVVGHDRFGEDEPA